MSTKYLPAPVHFPLLSYKLCTHQEPTETIAPHVCQLLAQEFAHTPPPPTNHWGPDSVEAFNQALAAAASAMFIYNFSSPRRFIDSDAEALDADWRAAATDFNNVWLTACQAAKAGISNVGHNTPERGWRQSRSTRKEKV